MAEKNASEATAIQFDGGATISPFFSIDAVTTIMFNYLRAGGFWLGISLITASCCMIGGISLVSGVKRLSYRLGKMRTVEVLHRTLGENR